MNAPMRIWVPSFCGEPMPRYSAATIHEVRTKVLASGNFYAGDQWEKAERHGWVVKRYKLVEDK